MLQIHSILYVIEGELYNRISIAEIVGRVDGWASSVEGAAGSRERVCKSVSCSRTSSRCWDSICDRIFPSSAGGEFNFCALVEHVIIAIGSQDSCRKCRNLSETGTFLEHLLIAISRQCGCRQSRCLGEIGAPAEHVLIAIVRQRSSR